MSYLHFMGWNEILARVFDGFAVEKNASPDWLVNPATKRKLKLDYLYPEIGVAVRFVGMKAKGQRRKSDWEELEERSRDETRRELCRQHGIDLILLDPNDPFPDKQLRRVQMTIGGAARRIAKTGRFKGKADLMRKLDRANRSIEAIRKRVKKTEDLALYAESWRDREAQAIADLKRPAPQPKRKINPNRLKVGQRVKHSHFGVGVVTAIEPGKEDTYVTIDFVTKGERKFALSLLAGKLLVARKMGDG
ncbi:MAG TPA: hypothetical protein G4O05_01230 [Caldilineae bacterium]|nr:hypothetical protein [Caldilineae bacterium]HIQ11963.1 hypothetical protein [Caldilineales bacterium]